MGPYKIKFWHYGNIVREWDCGLLAPLVPRRGDRILGEEKTWVVSQISYEYFMPSGVDIHVYIEEA